jgi:hypothetical protein
MRIFDYVEYPNLMRDELLHRFPMSGPGAFHTGSQMTVRSNQNAVFFLDGRALDLFGPGQHTLATKNIPMLVDKIGKGVFDEAKPFSAEVYFVNMSEIGDRTWGIPSPILFGSEKTGFTYIQGFGKFSFKVTDPRMFVEKFIVSSDTYKITDIENRLRSLLLSTIDESIYEADLQNDIKIPAEIIRYKNEIAANVLNKAQADFDRLALMLTEFYIENLNIPSKSQEMLLAAGLSGTPAAATTLLAIPIDPKFVFVIMSFDKRLDPVYQSFRMAASAVGLNAQRVSDQLGDYRITDRIIENIHKACLLITDLSLERPNVYFELGYARGLGKTVIETALEGTNLHFDVKDWTCIFYSISDQDTLIRRLKQRLEYELTNVKK